ncbi:mannose-6-phosphate isomerase, class I [soil metagenome]
MVDLLDCTVMPYAWGSRSAIAELTGRSSPSPGPEAELWMGAHPMAPARIRRAGVERGLADVITEDPPAALGPEVVRAFGPRLPFLLKVLAAAEPLSLQAHPTEAQARAGFADEDARGVPRDAPSRNYRDPQHKPELLCALTPVDALCGFRRAQDTLRLFDELSVPGTERALAPLRASPDRTGLAETFRVLMTLPRVEGAALVAATVRACRESPQTAANAFAREHRWAVRLDALYPGDVGVVSALLLNLVHLEPGEAIYLGAGNLHAYLDGVGIEIMASSDNVLRGGLTKKHVDVPALMRVLDFADGPVRPLRAEALADQERVYVTPAREFRLSVMNVTSGNILSRPVRGPEILLCTEGDARLTPGDGSPELPLGRGASAFVPAATGRYDLRPGDAGHASLYRATVNLT